MAYKSAGYGAFSVWALFKTPRPACISTLVMKGKSVGNGDPQPLRASDETSESIFAKSAIDDIALIYANRR